MEKLSALKPKYPVLCPERLLFVLRNGAWLVETIRASGHVRRVNRPDTRPHLTNYKSQKRTCKKGAIHTRTSLQFTGVGESLKTILVTSSEMSEGKTTTAFKLASDFAALGRKVLVIDADMRKPRMHRVFGTDNAFGLSNLLTNVIRSSNVTDLFRTTNNPNITLLTSGTIPPNPADILSSQKMGLTLHYCSKKFDLVIVDSPPIMGLSDAPILARQLDATLLVVSSKQVTRKSAKNALARLKSAGANVVGCAFTKFAVDQLDYNYAYRYMQYNYYAYEDDKNVNNRLENHGTEYSAETPKSSRAAGYVSAIIDRISGRAG